ncbi:MAG: alanine dehydrogenase [Syntrophobacteraceae bacterium]|jgi:alanine dehydrogenase
MDIGVPRERRSYESRVGLTPTGVELLRADGHNCYVESGAGLGAGFADLDYQKAGARIVYSGEEVYGRGELVLKVARPTVEESEWVREGQILMGFVHLAAARRSKVELLLRRRVTTIAYETVENEDGSLPILAAMSLIAGRMSPHVAATLLQNDRGGKGVLLEGVPGVPSADVVILGTGTLGTHAARAFLGAGARVVVLGRDLPSLHHLDEMFAGRLTTMLSYPFNIRKVVTFADVLVGAVLVPGARAPILVTREMVASMRPRSLIMDLSIDQGGCVETSRPTTHGAPTYVEENVIHYCVPNMAGVVGRTATHALGNATWPFVQQIALNGLEGALEANPALARGVATRDGNIVNQALAEAMRTWSQ